MSANSSTLLPRWLLVGIGLIALAALAATITPYVVVFSGGVTSDQEKWGQFGDYIGGSLNPVFGFLSFALLLLTLRLQSRTHTDEKDFEASKEHQVEAILILSRAFETFVSRGDSPPKNDRVLWLTVARMLLRYRKLRSYVTANVHMTIADEHEEYWRYRFYRLLSDNEHNLTKDYFIPSGDKYGLDTVARASVAVIFDFSRWKESVEDPMKSVDDKELFANDVIPLHFLGVEAFIEEYGSYHAEIERRRQLRSSA